MGGRIWVESGPGKGSRFYIEVQLDKALEPILDQHASEPLTDIPVLVVDDNRANREILMSQLAGWKNAS
ncbi:hypothetical protein SAMN05216326_12349 [Nitrosomonas marina]|uniref:Uncharacterized protein n=2 Tax=Nitrosomonas marina TaxID=917 RepID=A0A1I0DXX7_9PROT|nr:hypothetical protein SAMN05216326_12349 [Nitrosomonas marina]